METKLSRTSGIVEGLSRVLSASLGIHPWESLNNLGLAPVGSEGIREGLEAPGMLEGPQIQQDLPPSPAFHVDYPQRAEFQQDWDPSRRGAPNPTGEGQCRSLPSVWR